MVKNKSNQYRDAQEYLEQVEWQNQQSQRRVPLPWYMTPKWRYKRLSAPTRHNDRLVEAVVALIILLIACLTYLLVGRHVFLPIVILVIGGMILLAIHDASKRPKDDD